MNIPSPKEIHDNAIAHGWYEKATKDNMSNDFIPAKLALIHSEISEALEAYRKDGVGKIHGEPGEGTIAEELADAVIRIFDIAEFLHIDLEKAITEKHNYNISRPYKHGGKIV